MKNSCYQRQMINRGAWSSQEDEKLIKYIRTHGEGRWRTIPKAAGLLRCGKSCRLRWINYLRPDIKRGNFGEDEDDLIIKLHALLGNRWSLIAGRLPGRTDNEIKNQWNSRLSRKVKGMGVNPYKNKWISVVPSTEEAALTSSFSDLVKDDLCPRPGLNLELAIGLPFSLPVHEGQERSHQAVVEDLFSYPPTA